MNLRTSIRPGIACLMTVGLCVAYASVRHQLTPWWREHGGGVPWVLFWILLWLTLIPRRNALLPICVGCVLITCGLELFQLWEGPIWLQQFRQTRMGAAWLGSQFAFADLPPYFIGGVLGWGIGRLLVR